MNVNASDKRTDTLGGKDPIIDPALPIVDAHHHLWFLTESALTQLERTNTVLARGLAPIAQRRSRYLFDELLTDLRSGHNIRATVFVDAFAMYRTTGPEAMRSAGEVEFASGVAAMAESGTFGHIKACAAIVGNVDLRLGDAVEEVLTAHIQLGGGRYRGVRCGVMTAYDPDPTILGPGIPHLLLNPQFRTGFRWLSRHGLSFDVFVLEPQLPEVIDLARTFPDTQIILNHVGGPVGVGAYASARDQRFVTWQHHIRLLGTCPNVAVKLGGLGIPLVGLPLESDPFADSITLASHWKPYIETCIEAFGAARCMFESNFPVDSGVCSYATLWNAFKRLTVGASTAEKTALFSGTANKVYKLSA